MIGILDNHFPGDVFGDRKRNPHRQQELDIGRRFNVDLVWSMDSAGVDGVRVGIDHLRPKTPWRSRDLKVNGCIEAGADMAIEVHCNYCPQHNGHGRLIMVKADDLASVEFGIAIANRWAEITQDDVPLVRCPDPRYPHNPAMFRLLADRGISFVLPEIGALNRDDIREGIEERDATYIRMVEAVTAAALECGL